MWGKGRSVAGNEAAWKEWCLGSGVGDRILEERFSASGWSRNFVRQIRCSHQMFLRMPAQSCHQEVVPGGSLHSGKWGKEVGSYGQGLIIPSLEDKREEAAKVAQRF